MTTAVLADTHFIIWLRTTPERLNRDERHALDTAEVRYLSVASLWEIAILMSLGRVAPEAGFFHTPEGFELLPIQPEHCRALAHLPRLHRDPFDRMLIAQARSERLPLLTRDRAVRDYADAGLVGLWGYAGGSGNSSR